MLLKYRNLNHFKGMVSKIYVVHHNFIMKFSSQIFKQYN